MAVEAEWEDRFFKQAEALIVSAAKASVRDGTVPSIGREAIKDVRNTIHEIFFGRPEGQNEPGTPLNPTQGEIAADRREANHPYGFSQSGVDYSWPAPGVDTAAPVSAGDIANDRDIPTPAATVHGQEHSPNVPPAVAANAGDIAHDRDGQVLEQKSWTQKERERQQMQDGGSEGYDRQKERIKPEEERQERKEPERGGRC